MQKAETSTLDAQAKVESPKMVVKIEISIDDHQKVYVNWPADKREQCVVAIAEAIKLIETYRKPIVEVAKPSILDFVRGIKR